MAPVTLPPVAPAIDAFGPSRPVGPAGPEAARGPGESFGDALGKAIAGLDGLQQSADRSAEQVALGGGNLHETALALEKADTAMHLAVKVRNKIVDAYQEIMRMGV
jgi:flagellar hook-basal body complex protein FliE